MALLSVQACGASLFHEVHLITEFFLLQSGVSEVVFFVEKRLENSDIAYIASHKLLSLAGVKVSPSLQIFLDFGILLSLSSVGLGIMNDPL